MELMVVCGAAAGGFQLVARPLTDKIVTKRQRVGQGQKAVSHPPLVPGCFPAGGLFWLWCKYVGTVKTDMQFTEVESLLTDQLLWKLRGTAVYDVNFYYAATEESQDAAASTGTGTAAYNVEAQIFKDTGVWRKLNFSLGGSRAAPTREECKKRQCPKRYCVEPGSVRDWKLEIGD